MLSPVQTEDLGWLLTQISIELSLRGEAPLELLPDLVSEALVVALQLTNPPDKRQIPELDEAFILKTFRRVVNESALTVPESGD